MSTICFDPAPVRTVPAIRRLRSSMRRFRAGLAGVASKIAREWRIRQATRQLEEMPDSILADIGLARAEIDHALRNGRPWRDRQDDGRGRGQG